MSRDPFGLRIRRFAFFRSRNVERPSSREHPVAEPRRVEGGDDVLPHVIAARADAGADERAYRAGRHAQADHGGHGLPDDRERRPPPACVHDGAGG